MSHVAVFGTLAVYLTPVAMAPVSTSRLLIGKFSTPKLRTLRVDRRKLVEQIIRDLQLIVDERPRGLAAIAMFTRHLAGPSRRRLARQLKADIKSAARAQHPVKQRHSAE